MKRWILAVSLCLLVVPALAGDGNDHGQNNNDHRYGYHDQSNDHHGAPAPLIGAGIEGLMAVGGGLLGAKFLRRRKKQS